MAGFSGWSDYRASNQIGDWAATITSNLITIAPTDTSGGQEEAPNDPVIVSFESGRSADRTDYDVLVRVRCATYPASIVPSGVSLFARLPEGSFTPSSGKAYMLYRTGTALQLHAGKFMALPPDDEVDLGAQMTVGDWYWMRLQVVRDVDAGTEDVRGKMWAVGSAEPDWQVEVLDVSVTGANTPSAGGTIGVGNGGNGWTATQSPLRSYEWDFVSDSFASTADRLRSHVSEDAGSLFQATQAVAVESAVSEAFPYGTDLSAGALRSFSEALTPDDTAIRYYPLPTRNQEMLVTVEGETKLGRMARTYPPAIMARVANIPDLGEATATPQEIIEYVFSRWASVFDWFTYETVPDLRLLVDGAVGAPRQYYVDNPEAGVLNVEAIALPQEDDARLSMREIVDQWLATFPGTTIRQNSSGNIELVPRVGPDAPEDAAVDLTWRDLISISDGEDDPRGVINRARVVSQGWSFEENQAVIPDSYNYQPRPSHDGLSETVVEDEGDIPVAQYVAYKEFVPFSSILHPTDDVKVTVTVSVYGSWQANSSEQYGLITTETEEFDLSVAETGTVSVSVSARGSTSVAKFTVRREHVGISLFEITGLRSRHYHWFGSTWLGYLVEISATGTAWVKASGQTTAEFGYGSETLPGPDGTNALETSVNSYGEREAIIRSDVFQLTPEQAQQVARAHVLFNINPRTIRDVQQSEWNKYPVKFDHVGQLVDLPNGETAVVENRAYTDSFQPGGGFMQSTFTATVTESVLDTTTAFLLMDDGYLMYLDSADAVEQS